MEITIYSLSVILGCGIVTWIPRVFPFILIKKFKIPKIIFDFLSYVPLCILTGLFVQHLFIKQENQFPEIHYEYLYASIPTVFTAIITRNLIYIILIGVITTATIRYFF